MFDLRDSIIYSTVGSRLTLLPIKLNTGGCEYFKRIRLLSPRNCENVDLLVSGLLE